MTPEEEQRQVEDAHSINDLALELGKYRRKTRAAELMLIDALHALNNGVPSVTAEYLDRTIRELSALRTNPKFD